MGEQDILDKVRRAVHVADSLHAEDAALVAQLLEVAERSREVDSEFRVLLNAVRPSTDAGVQARAELLQQLSTMERREDLLRRMLDATGTPESEIFTETPPSQLQ